MFTFFSSFVFRTVPCPFSACEQLPPGPLETCFAHTDDPRVSNRGEREKENEREGERERHWRKCVCRGEDGF